MQKIDRLIDQNLRKYKIENKVKSLRAVECWQQIIAEFYPEADGKTMALHIKNGVLTVASLSREVASIIISCQKQLINLINQMIGKQVVFGIYCVV